MTDPLQQQSIRAGERLTSYAALTLAFLLTLGGLALFLVLT